MTVLIKDPGVAARLIAERAALGHDGHDEVWDGVYVVSPLANMNHQLIVSELTSIVRSVIDFERGDRVYGGLNVSNRDQGWLHNFRVPDVAVILAGNPARDCGTHCLGGPDLVVEVLSSGDQSREKLPFYAALGVREVLIVDRQPWALELYQLRGDRFELVGLATPGASEVLSSAVLPLTFRLTEGSDRPRLRVEAPNPPRTWTV